MLEKMAGKDEGGDRVGLPRPRDNHNLNYADDC